VLIFRENRRRQEDRLQAALCAVVASGKGDPAKAWPEYFGEAQADDEESFPETGADMSQFTWEQPDQERMQSELEMLMRGAHVTLRDGEPAEPPEPPPQAALRPMVSRMGPATAEELEWS